MKRMLWDKCSVRPSGWNKTIPSRQTGGTFSKSKTTEMPRESEKCSKSNSLQAIVAKASMLRTIFLLYSSCCVTLNCLCALACVYKRCSHRRNGDHRTDKAKGEETSICCSHLFTNTAFHPILDPHKGKLLPAFVEQSFLARLLVEGS